MNVLRVFRVLLVAQPTLLMAALVFWVFTGDPISFDGAEELANQEPDAIDGALGWVEAQMGFAGLVGIVLLSLAAYIASLIGLYKFRRWGRVLYVIGFLVGLALVPFVSGEAAGSAETLLDTLLVAGDGAILALAFLGPVADKINGTPGTTTV